MNEQRIQQLESESSAREARMRAAGYGGAPAEWAVRELVAEIRRLQGGQPLRDEQGQLVIAYPPEDESSPSARSDPMPATLPWIVVEKSTNVHSIRYQPAAERLDVRFKDAKTGEPDRKFYRYQGVPLDMWEGLVQTSSKGKYHAAKIKGRYAFTEVPIDNG